VVGIPPRKHGRTTIDGVRRRYGEGEEGVRGYSINFKGCKDTAESIFGGSPIGPSEMTKKIWAYVKRKKLAGKK